MPVPVKMADLSTSASSNSPQGADSIGTSLDDHIRSLAAITKQNVSNGADIASSNNITIHDAGSYFLVTGNTNISGIADSWIGRTVFLEFASSLTLNHSSTFKLPGSANVVVQAGDVVEVSNTATGVWKVLSVCPVSVVLGATGIGYGIGAGGTATQPTSKTAEVTINKPSGQITTHNATLAAGASVVFVVRNTTALVGDSIDCTTVDDFGPFYVAETLSVWNGYFNIRLTNITGSPLAHAVRINFGVNRRSAA